MMHALINEIVVVTGIVSKGGKTHMRLRNLVGRSGQVVGISKDNMLLIGMKHGVLRAIPEGCVTKYADVKFAGTRYDQVPG